MKTKQKRNIILSERKSAKIIACGFATFREHYVRIMLNETWLKFQLEAIYHSK